MTKAQLIRVIIQLKDNTYTHDEMMRMTKKQLIDHFYRLADPTRFQERTEPYNPRYDEAYINEKIKKATKSWEGVDVDKFMDEMRGREVHSEALEEAAREIVIKMHPCLKDCTILGDRLTRGQLMALVKAGAEWQKSQMLKDGIDCEVKIDAGGYPYIERTIELYDYEKDEPLAKRGDKYKLVLLKVTEDEAGRI